MKKAKFKIFCAAVAVGAAALFLFDFFGKPSPVGYAEFLETLEKGEVKSAEFSEGKINFSNLSGEKFFAPNPQSPNLREKMLLKGVKIAEKPRIDEAISIFFDAIFYVFFFGAAIFAFRKFISPNTFKTVRKTGVRFDDLVGMEGLKRDFSKIVEILKDQKKFSQRGIRLPKGILLEGAPGNGKTLFARALAGEAGVNFIPAKATDFESMFMAIGPLKVKLLFAKARKRAPCIVFIDEFDGIGTRRNYSGSAIETENTRIVTALLNELDGFEPSQGILVVAATNSVRALDEALVRPGRFDAKYKILPPNFDERKALIERISSKKNGGIDSERLAKSFDGFSFAKIETALNQAAIIAAQNGRERFCADDVASALKNL